MKELRFYTVVIAVMLFILIIVSGCFSGLTNEEHSNYEYISVPSDKNLVKFGVESVRAESMPTWYVYYVGVRSGKGEIMEATDLSNVQLVLDKGDIYIIGIAKKEDYIKTVGLVGVPDLGLNSLPISEDSASVIDLGKLVQDGLILKPSSLVADDFARKVGFDREALEAFGNFDITLRKFINLDINRNGVLDRDEGMFWRFDPLYYFFGDSKDYSPDNPDISLRFFNWIFIKEKMDYEDLDAETSVLHVKRAKDGKEFEFKIGPYRIERGTYYWQYDPYEGNVTYDVDPPWDGDYWITVEDREEGKVKEFHFDNLMFIKPSEYFAGLVLPAYQFTAYSDGKLKNISWRWYQFLKNREKKHIDSEVTKLLIGNDINLYVFDSKYFHSMDTTEGSMVLNLSFISSNFLEDNDVDLEGSNLWVQSCSLEYGSFSYNDVGENEIKMFTKNKFLPYPHDFSEDVKLYSPGSTETLEGTWINISHITDDNPDTEFALKFYPDGKLEVCSNDFGVSISGSYSIDPSSPSRITMSIDGNTYYMLAKLARTYMEVQISQDGFPDSIARGSEGYRIYSRYNPYLPIVENPKAEVSVDSVTFTWNVNDEGYFEIDKYKVCYSTSKDEVINLTGKCKETTTHKVKVNISESETCYWRVIAVGEDGKELPGPVYNFEF